MKNIWIEVLEPLTELYGKGTIVEEEYARFVCWEKAGKVKKVAIPKDGKNKIVAYKAVKQSAKK